MAKKPSQPRLPAPDAQFNSGVETRVIEVQNLAILPAEADEVLAAGIDLGRLEALDFITTVGTASLLTVYENLKKSKGWRFLVNPKSSDGRKFESLKDFCEVKLGKSYQRFQELASNRNLIGQAAFEQAEKIGLRQVDYNAIKALPAPDQELIRRATEEAQSRDEVLALLHELAARHAAESTTLHHRLEEAEAEKAATDKVQADKQAEIDRLHKQLHKRKVAAYTDWPEAFKGYIDQAQKAKREILNAIDALAIVRQESLQIEPESDEESEALGRAWVALASTMQDIFVVTQAKLEGEATTFDNTLQAVADDHSTTGASPNKKAKGGK